jgi:hypothetical protein
MKTPFDRIDTFDMASFEATAEVVMKTNPYLKEDRIAWLNDKKRLVDYMVSGTHVELKTVGYWGTCGFYVHVSEDACGKIVARAYPCPKMVAEYINGLTK